MKEKKYAIVAVQMLFLMQPDYFGPTKQQEYFHDWKTDCMAQWCKMRLRDYF